ncbi:hypothetical protein [Actinoalloteichus hymeniacidonis]|uniref:Uncharacterized protein n=1 Tax=Actinoalloteichus hymeniacidonis TaxID=340345 RepID=A0AAC9HV98_9PSEU|nr:hypothetical protein [Actinoalloteichus hymeniacidonis]AOS65195.1 hypothetical protein TL08_22055 [Actinoalloteichus hymeniacidonis]MBB5906725.1 hypothetical protein [Actinoalloteichus hymeniacidonis]
MRIRTDDEVYRVDAVWLGPPKATFPWRARYVAWGIGVLVFLVVLTAERQMNIGFNFFSTAWAVVITVALTTFICSRISHERPFAAVLSMWARELNTPRQNNSARGGAASADRIRIHSQRPRPARSARGSASRRPSRGSDRKRNKNKEVRRGRAPRR